jgi:hypothetical protein
MSDIPIVKLDEGTQGLINAQQERAINSDTDAPNKALDYGTQAFGTNTGQQASSTGQDPAFLQALHNKYYGLNQQKIDALKNQGSIQGQVDKANKMKQASHVAIGQQQALTKQYQKLFGYEGVALKFTDDALKAIAQMALKRKTGARGLRSVIEESMMEIMFEIPSKSNVKEVIIDERVINGVGQPQLILKSDEEMRKASESGDGSAQSA